jgi:hypothetical protein
VVESDIVDDFKDSKVADDQDVNHAGNCDRRIRFQGDFLDRFLDDCQQFNRQQSQDDCVGCIDKVDPAQPLVFPAIFEGIIVEIY